MSGSIVLSIFWGLFALCSHILLISGSIIFLKRKKGAAAYLLLIGSLLSIFPYLIFTLSFMDEVIPLSTDSFTFILYVQAPITTVGSFCFAIGFYKLIKSIGKTQQENTTNGVPPSQI